MRREEKSGSGFVDVGSKKRAYRIPNADFGGTCARYIPLFLLFAPRHRDLDGITCSRAVPSLPPPLPSQGFF